MKVHYAGGYRHNDSIHTDVYSDCDEHFHGCHHFNAFWMSFLFYFHAAPHAGVVWEGLEKDQSVPDLSIYFGTGYKASYLSTIQLPVRSSKTAFVEPDS